MNPLEEPQRFVREGRAALDHVERVLKMIRALRCPSHVNQHTWNQMVSNIEGSLAEARQSFDDFEREHPDEQAR